MTMNKNRKGAVGVSKKKRRKVNFMRIIFIAIILMISIGLVGGSFLVLL